jgi:multiple sugar transport system substrate-binding protein
MVRHLRRRRSRLARLVVGALVVGSLTGPLMPAAATGPVRISFTWWGDARRRELTERQVGLFMVAHPRIEVRTEPRTFEGYYGRLDARIAAASAPDLITFRPSEPKGYGTDGDLLDLATVSDLVHLDDFPPEAYASATVGSSVYGLATGGDSVGLLVNEDLLDRAGLTLPDDATWGWDDFVAWAGDAAPRLPEGVYATDWRIAEAKGPFAAQRGHPLYTPDGRVGLDAATVEALLGIPVALVANGGMPPAQITAALRNTRLEQTLFGQGRAATMIASTSDLQGFHDLLGAGVRMARIPGETPQRPGLTVTPTQSLGIWSGSRHPRAAAMLLAWLLDEPESAKVILADRGVPFEPAIRDAIRPSLAEGDRERMAYVERVALEGGSYVPPPPGSGQVDGLWLRTEDMVLFRQATPAEAATQLVDGANAIIVGARGS